MKALQLLLLTALLTPVASFASHDEEEGPQYCSAEVTYLDGSEQTVRVECDGPYAGKCLKEEYVGRSLHTKWTEVECKK